MTTIFIKFFDETYSFNFVDDTLSSIENYGNFVDIPEPIKNISYTTFLDRYYQGCFHKIHTFDNFLW